MMQGETILIMDYAYAGRWRESQTWARILARENTVALVERRQNFDELRWRGVGLRDALARMARGEVQRPDERLTLLRPPAGPPLSIAVLSRFIGRAIKRMALVAGSWRRTRWIRAQLDDLGLVPTVLIVFHPFDLELVGIFGEKVACWRVYDELSVTVSGEDACERVRRAEAKGLSSVDLVFASSRSQYDKRRGVHPGVHLIPNGLDSSFLRGEKREEVARLGAVRRPRVGYVGGLDWRVDFELLAFVADRLPEVSFVIAGWVHPAVQLEFDRLEAKRNVYFLGEVPRAELPDLLASMDVGIIPFHVDHKTATMLPLKLFEYLGVGLPVVSTELEQVRPYAHVARLCGSAEEFTRALRQEVADHSVAERTARIRVAEKNTWDVRVEAVSSILERRLRDGTRAAGAR